MSDASPSHRDRVAAFWRIAWTVVSIVVVESLVCGLAALPVVLAWLRLDVWMTGHPAVRALVFSLLIAPSYLAFALCLMVLSAAATRVIGARTPANTEIRIDGMGWPLMQWVRYMVSIRVVRVLAGTLFCGSPVWTAYLRLNGARLGRRVYVNTLSISDHNLLEFGDDVVIGADAHLSGHTVEGGLVKTAGVHLGHHVTIGLGSFIDIGVDIGPHTQIGAMSLVPKHTKIPAGSVYAGIPIRRLQ